MGERGLLILLLAGFCVPAYNQIRKHVFVETKKSWSEAQSYCREKHTDLATVCSHEEAEQLLNITGASLGDSWIGLYRDDTQNWQWSNSDDVIYSNWRADVFCASVNSEGKWTDLPCHLQKAFMCYKGKDSGQCFYEGAGKTWQEAQSYCRNQGRDLPSIQDLARANEFIGLIPSTSDSDHWIGLYHDKENWQWSSGGDVIYSNWEPYLFCASVNSEGEWEDSLCSQRNYFMCYSETSTITERYTLIKEFKTWTEAQQYCREHHTDLVSIKNASENEEIVKKAQGKPFWIGLFNEPWKWSHQGDNYTFHSWNYWEPNNWGGDENCVVMSKTGGWNDYGCHFQLPFFCCEGTPVPEELHLISHSMVWPEAWQYCRDRYTDLVSLTSLAAQNRVSELVRNSTASRFWIGLHRTVVYDKWYWVAGKDKKAPLNYTNWAPGEPNNPYYEHCGEMVLREDGGAEWNDLCCYEQLPFICFKD
ncbi:macrophage mannose receptor 1-like [Acipenser ruthenus]|uniref:macrophage mannose receptor 1-like n=1 Tax=Acipenser ruthenus TaxID=7906 RepID=UPI0027422D49|nr:macrophage mannose receptor 1-like [Acipenser ruthenus]